LIKSFEPPTARRGRQRTHHGGLAAQSAQRKLAANQREKTRIEIPNYQIIKLRISFVSAVSFAVRAVAVAVAFGFGVGLAKGQEPMAKGLEFLSSECFAGVPGARRLCA